MTKRAVVLLVLSGWGLGARNSGNPIYRAEPKNMGYIRLNYPAGTLQASGIAVGLPWDEEGNSEVGYLTMGAGKVLYQDYPRINLAIKDGSFFKNEVLLQAVAHAKRNGTKVNIVGLLSESTSQSATEHLDALLALMARSNADFALHLTTDGLDSPRQSAARMIERLPQERIASLAGRYFSMDRDRHWERTLRAYDAMIGTAKAVEGDPVTILQNAYKQNLSDDFVSPVLLRPGGAIRDGDSVIFFNFSEDSTRQLLTAFLDPLAGGHPDYEAGETAEKVHPIPDNLHLVTLTKYGDQFKVPVAFPQEQVTEPLGKVLADAGKVQLRLAETEKYDYVTTLFNGIRPAPFADEYRVLIPSRPGAKVDEHPEMRVRDVAARILSAFDEGIYDFILADFANADMVAHTGNFDAALAAIKAIDDQVGLLAKAALGSGAVLVITADHGNAEVMIDSQTGLRETENNTSPVPLYVVAPGYERQKTEAQATAIEQSNTGVLSDVAPTILELMGIPKPAAMTGQGLLRHLR